MTIDASKEYVEATNRQSQRIQARTIRKNVSQARGDAFASQLRWPFELMQNALDAGPRDGRESVAVTIELKSGTVTFEHDGAAFTMDDFAALVSGGSNKEYDTQETTGRFGTGFLSTHVLSEQVLVEALLVATAGLECFRLTLDRGGSEDEILENVKQCGESIALAESVVDPEAFPSARFTYGVNERDVAAGIAAVRSALPYLYGTRPALGEVRIVVDDNVETWSATEASRVDLSDGYIEDRRILRTAGDTSSEYRILRASKTQTACAAGALLLLEKNVTGWEVRVPEDSAPRIYVQYPLRESAFLGINFVLDGEFQPNEQRSRLQMVEENQAGIADALAASLLLAALATDEGWRGYHHLARADAPIAGFDPTNEAELLWWRDALRGFADQLARIPMVLTGSALVPALNDDGDFADFILPRLFEEDEGTQTTVERMWHLCHGINGLLPPALEVAEDWSSIAQGWAGLGINLRRLSVSRVGEIARQDSKNCADLPVSGDPDEWLAAYLDVVGECWSARHGTEESVLRGLLPNQRGLLCSPEDLRRDADISEEVKDLSDFVGLALRDGLLSVSLEIHAARLSHASTALATSIKNVATPSNVIHELVDFLKSELPEGKECGDHNERLWRGTAKLFCHLWSSQGLSAISLAQQVPLLTQNGDIAHWSPDRKMLAPVIAWGVAARPFSEAYPLRRVMDDVYLSDEFPVEAFEAWDIAYLDPLVTMTRELEGPRLAAMAENDLDMGRVVVRGEEVSQIALLSPEVLNHVQNEAQARALFGLVLCHIAPNDQKWRELRSVRGTRERESVGLVIRPALWLGDLKSRAWVPVRGEDDSPAKAAATKDTLNSILDPTWLNNNDAALELLIDCFGFDELNLRILGIPSEAQSRVRQGLARLLQSGGNDPEFYESLADQVEAKKRRDRDVGRWRRIGLAIQEAIGLALTSRGLSVELVDRGFDFEVGAPTFDDTLDGFGLTFDVGTYLVEVKATTLGPVRLTPAQARTAATEAQRFVLCVVDLRGVAPERLDQEWSAQDVEPLTTIHTSVGTRVDGTYELIVEARDSDVGIRNEAALRYEVPPGIWMSGLSIAAWVESLSTAVAD